MKKLAVRVGRNLGAGELLEALRESEDLANLLISDVEENDPRATAEDGVRITDIEELGGGVFSINYEYDWSAYYGCRDMNNGDTFYSNIRFRYKGGVATFEMPESDFRARLE